MSLARSLPEVTRSRFMECPAYGRFIPDSEQNYPSWRFDRQFDGKQPRFDGQRLMSRSLPLILTLDQHGVPHRWVTWQQAVWYYAKQRIAWEVGSEAFTVTGGRCHRTGEISSITANSIIAIRGKALAIKGFNQVPPLNNRELFNRDRFVCAFCSGNFSPFRLTCDHILPMSRGGRDTWMNVVTAFRACNQKKGSRTRSEERRVG